MNFLQMRLARQVANEAESVLRRTAGRQILWPRQHLLPLSIKSHRQTRLNVPQPIILQPPKRILGMAPLPRWSEIAPEAAPTRSERLAV
jgi:hypothetical protein